MDELIKHIRTQDLWTISVQRLILYILAVGVFLALHEVWAKIAGNLKVKVDSGAKLAWGAVFLLAAVLLFAGSGLFVQIARRLDQPRLAMLILPLVLILEKHVRQMRASPQDRRLPLLGAAGECAGLIGGMFAFMRAAPWK
jgi:hypothetical protein